MADADNGLLAIEIDADDYAEAAAGDLPSVSRTYQSEADFQAQKSSYAAKIDGGKAYSDFIAAVPVLESGSDGAFAGNALADRDLKIRLTKKQVQLLGYAVGELYYDKEYIKIIDLCDRVHNSCEVDGKTGESLTRWKRRCQERTSGEGNEGKETANHQR